MPRLCRRWWLIVLGIATALALAFTSYAPAATECRTTKPSGASHWAWRSIDGRRCWYPGSRGKSKSALFWPRARRVKFDSAWFAGPEIEQPEELQPPPEQQQPEPPPPEPEPEPEPEPPRQQLAMRWPEPIVTPPQPQADPPRVSFDPPVAPLVVLLLPIVLSFLAIVRAGRKPAIAHRRSHPMINEHQPVRMRSPTPARDPVFNAENLAPAAPQQPAPDPFPSVQSAAAQTTLLAAKKLIEESRAAITAAKGALEQLIHEQETYEQAILAYAKSHADQVTSYLDRCQSAASSMQNHRESMLSIAQSVANGGQPATEGATS